ncbi:decapping and exoribonuclease protein Rai1-like [Arctopsyche grandis]|uniref:decapping and exoribonuclease protein Rai1-like n=1 Tax=Arctopsyche grandis TaxID=121162 RepID=UPI00406D83F2
MLDNQIYTGPRKYSHLSTEMSGPSVVGYFSVDKDMELVNDTSRLKYMVGATGVTHMDLTHGTYHRVDKCIEDKRLPFFKYLLDHKQLLESVQSSVFYDVGFVTTRSTLVAIAQMPYSRQAVLLGARMINGAIYIYNTADYIDRPVESYATKLYSKWGYKFRQHILSDSVLNEPDISVPIMEHEEFVGVFKLELKKHKILYRAEIQGLLSTEDIPTGLDEAGNIAELNQSEIITVKTKNRFINDVAFR